jgi:hypothetical protein
MFGWMNLDKEQLCEFAGILAPGIAVLLLLVLAAAYLA